MSRYRDSPEHVATRWGPYVPWSYAMPWLTITLVPVLLVILCAPPWRFPDPPRAWAYLHFLSFASPVISSFVCRRIAQPAPFAATERQAWLLTPSSSKAWWFFPAVMCVQWVLFGNDRCPNPFFCEPYVCLSFQPQGWLFWLDQLGYCDWLYFPTLKVLYALWLLLLLFAAFDTKILEYNGAGSLGAFMVTGFWRRREHAVTVSWEGRRMDRIVVLRVGARVEAPEVRYWVLTKVPHLSDVLGVAQWTDV